MENQNKLILLAVVLFAIILAGIFLLWRTPVETPSQGGENATSTATSTATTTPNNNTGLQPVTPDQQKRVEALTKQGNDAYRAGNLTSARDYWEQAIAIHPEATAALGGLAQLYTVDIKDNAKAEMYYKKAAESLIPGYGAAMYRALLDFYTNTGYKANTAAYETSAKQGIQRNPKAIDLQILLARYYVTKDRTADAKVQFESAAKAAEAAGNNSLAAQIRAESASL